MGKQTKLLLLILLVLILVASGLLIGFLLSDDDADNEESEDVQESTDVQKQYISDYQVDQPDLADQVSTQNEEDEEPDVLGAEAGRKVVKFAKNLPKKELRNLEKKYKVKFTDDVAFNGVYSLTANASSDLTGLSSEVASFESMETDIEVRIAAQSVDWGVERVGTTQVMNKYTGEGIKVAVLDTGTQLDHPDLVDNIISGYDFVNNDADPSDDSGHGTHIAGIIAASNNDIGTLGVAHNTKIMPVKVLNGRGSGYLSDVLQGIFYAMGNDADIINLSLVTFTNAPIFEFVVDFATENGVLVVGAAGNYRGQTCLYPAAYSSVICVVATDRDNRVASFSNLGGDLSAPGVSNYSTYPGSRYAYLSGTSMATPHVSGAAAAVMQACNCSAAEVRTILEQTAVDLGEEGKDGLFGYGLIDLVAATQKGKGNLPSTTPPPAEERGQSFFKKPAATIQDLVVTNPETKRIMTDDTELFLQFALDPVLGESDLSQIELYLDNEEIYSTDSQSGSYNLSLSDLANGQYFIRIIAKFNDSSLSFERLILEVDRPGSNLNMSRANPINPGNKKILGIITRFDY